MRATRVRCVPRRLRTFACALLGLVTVLSGAPAATRVAWNAGQADSVTILESSATIARDISGGQRHVYQITISEDQYASVAIDHQGVELVERLAGADAVATIEAKSAGGDGEDLLQFTVDTPTTYRIQVEPKYPKAPAGKYEIRVAALRPATDTDRVLHDARRQAFQAFELYRAGAFDRARVAVERALEIRERVLGSNHAEVAAALNALGLIVAAKGDNKTAEMLYRRALAVDEATHETAATVDVLENLSRACARSGDFAEAERVARRGLAIAEQAFAPDHFRVAESLVALADVYLFKNDTTTSREWSERAFEIAARWYGADEVPPSFSTRAAVVQLNLGNYSRAEQLFAQGVSVAERTVGKDTPTAAEAILGLAYFYVTRGDNLKAEEHYLHGLAILENTVGRHHLQVAAVLDNLGLIAYRRRDWATAEATLGRSIAIKEQPLARTVLYSRRH